MRLRSDALAAPGFGAIAEFKRRSPSAGDLRPDGDVAAIAQSYERGGRAGDVGPRRRALRRHLGRPARRAGRDDAAAARERLLLDAPTTSARAREAGADAALLLLRDLDDGPARPLMRVAVGLGLDTLVEAHDADELHARDALGRAGDRRQRARPLDLRDRPRCAARLLASAPRDRILIAESAIATRAQGAAAELAGANAMLVGSTLMRAPDPGAKLAELLHRPLVKVCGLTRQEDVDAAVEAGADLVGFILAKESPRRTDELLDAPDDGAPRRCVRRRRARDRRRSRPVLRARGRAPRTRRRLCAGAASRSARSSTCPGRPTTRRTSTRARRRGPRDARRRARARERRAQRSRRCGRGPSTLRDRPSARPASKTMTLFEPGWRQPDDDRRSASTAGATCPRR